MARKKVSDGSIESLSVDWGHDSSQEGLPFPGSEIQRFIKQCIQELQDKTRFFYYEEEDWDELTNYDTDYSNVPEGLQLIYEGDAPTPEEGATYDSSTGVLTLASDAVYTTDGFIILGRTSSYVQSTGILTL